MKTLVLASLVFISIVIVALPIPCTNDDLRGYKRYVFIGTVSFFAAALAYLATATAIA
jgi:hypothetical protein